MKYKAFISYRHTENGRRHAVALETALKRYAKPTLSRPMKIFRDEKHMKPDISLPKLIRDGLENSEYLIFLAEKAAAESQWCGEELEMWCGALDRTDRLIIALIDDDIALDGTNGINWEQTTALPRLLQPYLTSIPLYMDLRWAKSDTDTDLQHPKYRHEINALAARLRGVNPEDLNDEEIRVFRRNIRLRNGAIAVLLAMLLVSVGAAWWAFRQQKIAEEQTLLAKQNEQTANEKTAEAQRNLDKAIVEEKRATEALEQVKKEKNATELQRRKAIEKTIEAEQNLAKAQVEEERTRLALIQVEKEKNATEAQRREAQKNFENAERERKRAESQLSATKLSSIKKLPENFDALILLDSLDCTDWNLYSVSSEIGKLQNLQWLNLSRNSLKRLPAEIGNLQKLHSLILWNNQLNNLPTEIGNLHNLKSLDLGGNPWNNLFIEIENLQKLPNLLSLDLRISKLSSLPAEIGKLQNLQSLNLSINQLSNLPAEIGKLQNLQSLNLYGNQLISLPVEIGKLQNLQSIDLSFNQLFSLPAEIGNLQSLQSLSLMKNQLISLPPEIGNLQNLKNLILYENQLSSLPAEVGNLQSLQSLSLYNNQFSGVPAEIGKLRNLQELDLGGNQLRSLPINDLKQMQNLMTLVLVKNPLKKGDVEALRRAMPWCKIVWDE